MISAAAKPVPSPLLRLCNVRKTYTRRGRLFQRERIVCAVEDVSLRLSIGSTTAIVGQSGAGKSTLARCIAGLEDPTSGQIYLSDVDSIAARRYRRRLASRVQLIFQDSAAALNPRFNAAEIIGEPLVIQGVGRYEIARKVAQLMDAVALPAEAALRHPLQLSGGQRQRLAIARALALQPSLLVLDEAFCGLDVSNQNRILDLLADLRQRLGLTFLHISHDLRLIADVADEIAIMYRGRIVEQGATQTVIRHPRHPHTRDLLAAVPGDPLAACRS